MRSRILLFSTIARTNRSFDVVLKDGVNFCATKIKEGRLKQQIMMRRVCVRNDRGV